MKHFFFVLLLFSSILTTIETSIVYFDASVIIPLVGNVSTFGSDYIQMWAKVIQCSPTDGCSCKIDPGDHSLIFPSISSDLASMNFTNLQPVTSYTYVLTCQNPTETISRTIKTDVAAPSVPQNLNANITENQRIKLFWSKPATPAGPIDLYRIFVDKNPKPIELNGDEFAYEISEKYVFGVRREFFLSACNINREKTKVCSSANDGKIEFYLPQPPTTPTSSSSSKKFSSAIVIFQILFIFIRLRFK